MKFITSAWFVNEPTEGDWLRIGVHVGDRVQFGNISDAALAEVAIEAGNMSETLMELALLRAIRAFAREHPDATVPTIRTPVKFE